MRFRTLATLTLVSIFTSSLASSDPAPSRAEIAVEFRASKVHGLVNFVETIAGEPHRSHTLKESFEKSSANDAQSKKLIAAYQELYAPLHANGEFPGYPDDRRTGFSINKILLSTSAFAAGDSLDAFLASASAILPPDVSGRYAEVMRGLLPVYEVFVWNDAKKRLPGYLARMKANARKWGMPTIIADAARFYGADWPQGLPFTVAFYPMPGKSGHSSAESLGSFESVGFFLDEADGAIAERFGVMVHEICHSFYEAQPKSLQAELARAFEELKTPHATLAAQTLNEGLATALGNGWANAVATGKLDERSWYNDKQVDQFARALYAEVKRYVGQGKSLDRAFAVHAAATFEKLFPDAHREMATIMRDVTVITEGKELKGTPLGQALRAEFRVSSMSRVSPATSPETLSLAEKATNTLIVAATSAELDGLTALTGKVKGLGAAFERVKALTGDAVYAAPDANGRMIIVVKVGTGEKFAVAMKRLKELAVVPKDGKELPL